MLYDSQITELNEWIKDCCGTPEVLAQYLDLAVEMRFYIKLGSFEQQEIQDVVTILRGLKKIVNHPPNLPQS